MSTKHQKFIIEIPDDYTARERRAIAQDIIERIVERTQSGKDKRGRDLPGYSESYTESLNFKIAGKRKSDVNLTQSGDMLGAIDLLSQATGQIVVGFEDGSLSNAIADGNIRGTYGQSKSVGPKRDFLGLTKRELNQILAEYPLDDAKTRKQNSRVSEASRSQSKGKDVNTEDDG